MSDLTGYARSVASVIDRASVLLAWLSIGAITAMMIVTGADVFLRYFGRGVMGIVEFVGNYLMVAVVFLPLAYGMTKEGHITVDFLVSRINKRLRTSLESLGLIFAFLSTWIPEAWLGTVPDPSLLAHSASGIHYRQLPFFVVKILQLHDIL